MTSMEERISDTLLGMDRHVRFVGVVTDKGEVIEGGFQNEVSPLLDQSKEQQIYLETLSTIDAVMEFSESLGDLVCNITEYRKVVLLTFPLKRGRILCISVCPGIDLLNFKDQVLRLLARRHH
ncbi:MAG: hypothetical protein M3297_06595 [Thermoproteota archaeon]|jgi:hypothetical protein|nr:hypothetical protein [Thermoproteota archaeon]